MKQHGSKRNDTLLTYRTVHVLCLYCCRPRHYLYLSYTTRYRLMNREQPWASQADKHGDPYGLEVKGEGAWRRGGRCSGVGEWARGGGLRRRGGRCSGVGGWAPGGGG